MYQPPEKKYVALGEVEQVVRHFLVAGEYGFDTETTGLVWYGEDRPFALILADRKMSYYFDFNPSSPSPLPSSVWKEIEPVFDVRGSKWFAHNAKFDTHMLDTVGCEFGQSLLHCTMAHARVSDNRYPNGNYDLDKCLKRDLGIEKNKTVDEYIDKHKLTSKIEKFGSKLTLKHFDRVPLDVMFEYGCDDAHQTLFLGLKQIERIKELSEEQRTWSKAKTLEDAYRIELHLTRVTAGMESHGVLVDREYCKKARRFEIEQYSTMEAEWERETGSKFVDSGKAFAKEFDKRGIPYARTDKGNPRFDAKAIEGLGDDNPLGRIIKSHRYHYKRAHTYWENFLWFSRHTGRIHAQANQTGTDTGRMSYSGPNLQNLPKNSEDTDTAFPIRRAIIPDPGSFFAMIDYDQVEYRFFADLAQEDDLISEVLKGLDIHEATAREMGVTRTEAKTLNFMLIYGGGIDKLAGMLGVTRTEAIRLREKYFSKLRRLTAATNKIRKVAASREFIINWTGWRCYYEGRSEYPSPNHLVQGSCGHIVKKAMIDCEDTLIARAANSRMLLQVHDELLFKIDERESDLPVLLQQIMASAYTPRRLPLSCSVEWSKTSWHDKEEYK